MNPLKKTTFLALAALPVLAPAYSLHLYSAGGATDTGFGPPTFSEVVLEQSGGFGPLTGYVKGEEYDFDLQEYAPYQEYYGTAGTFAIVFDDPTTILLTGTWTVNTLECTGIWAGVTGSGSYTRTYVGAGRPRLFDTTLLLDGEVFGPDGRGVVPEPASMASLGMGVLAVLRRRRKE